MIPYRLVEGQLVKGTIFAVKGDGSIFPIGTRAIDGTSAHGGSDCAGLDLR